MVGRVCEKPSSVSSHNRLQVPTKNAEDRGREQADLVLILLLMWASYFPPPSLPLLLSPSLELPPFLLYLPTILL
uniref:Uncharacterized protein n=1 Tax=Fagus sylvatica TaxID=28930 RepID=A0A2N9GT85_FAGSY